MVTKMRYYFNSSFSVGVANTANTHVITCNGIHDPDITFTGHQPRGRDQLHPLYDHHVVLGSKMVLRMTAKEGEDVIPLNFGIAIRDSPSVSASPSDYMETRTVKSNVVSSANGSRTAIMKVNPAKWLGRSKPLADPELKGSQTSNPTEQCYFHIFAYAQEATTVYYYNGYVDYIVAFIEPRQPGES